MVDINQRERTIRIKIVYYGPALGGKTTNLRVLHEHALGPRRGEFISVNSMQDRTILCDLLPLRSGGFRGYDLKLQLLAVPGQAMYSVTRRVVLKAADGVVFVANSASDRWYENTQSLEEMNENLVAHQIDPNTVPFVIQYNKRDLPKVIELATLAGELNVRHAPAFPAVAKTGAGVLETFGAILSATIQELARRYRTLDLPPGYTVESWAREAIKGMFGRERLEAPPTERPVREVDEPPVEIELADGTSMAIGGAGQRRVRVPMPEDAPRAATAAREARAPEAHPPEALAASYAEASTELGFAMNDVREERDAAIARLEEMRRALDLATEAPGSADVESRTRRMLQVLAKAGGASGATLRLVTGETPHFVLLPPLLADPLSRTIWGQDHLARLGDVPEPLVEDAVDAPQLTDALRAGEPSFEGVVLVPLRSAERLLGLALLYYDLHAVLPSRDTLAHLGFLARELAGPLEASAARQALAAAGRHKALSRAAAAGVASLLARLPATDVRRQQLDLGEVLRPLLGEGVVVEASTRQVAVSADACLLRFALATLIQLCETDAVERGQDPEITIAPAAEDGSVRITVSGGGRASLLAAPTAQADSSEAELTVVQTIADLLGGELVHGRNANERPEFSLRLERA